MCAHLRPRAGGPAGASTGGGALPPGSSLKRREEERKKRLPRKKERRNTRFSNQAERMKKIIENIDFLYHSQEPTGEVIIDEVISALQKAPIVTGEDLAILLDANPYELRCAWHLLTGTTLTQAIIRWRVLQALDLLKQKGYEWDNSAKKCTIPASVLQEVAKQCGWRSYRVLKNALRRQ